MPRTCLVFACIGFALASSLPLQAIEPPAPGDRELEGVSVRRSGVLPLARCCEDLTSGGGGEETFPWSPANPSGTDLRTLRARQSEAAL